MAVQLDFSPCSQFGSTKVQQLIQQHKGKKEKTLKLSFRITGQTVQCELVEVKREIRLTPCGHIVKCVTLDWLTEIRGELEFLSSIKKKPVVLNSMACYFQCDFCISYIFLMCQKTQFMQAVDVCFNTTVNTDVVAKHLTDKNNHMLFLAARSLFYK